MFVYLCLIMFAPSSFGLSVISLLIFWSSHYSRHNPLSVTCITKLYVLQTPTLVFCCCFGHVACGILVPPPETEPIPTAVKDQRLNHWTTRDSQPSPVLEVVRSLPF